MFELIDEDSEIHDRRVALAKLLRTSPSITIEQFDPAKQARNKRYRVTKNKKLKAERERQRAFRGINEAHTKIESEKKESMK